MRISCVGVGNMGGAVARRLVSGGFDVTVFDISEQAVHECVAAGAKAAGSVRAAAEGVDVVLTSLPTVQLVLDNVRELSTCVSAGSTIVDISTIDPHAAREAADTCARQRIRFVSCALGKTPQHAEQGQIPLFVGGENTAIDELGDVFARMGEKTYLFDDVEGATTFKLVSNLIGMSNVTVIAEGLALARRAGIPDSLFSEALEDTGAVSFQSSVRLPWMLEADWKSRFGVGLAEKDVRLALEAAQGWEVNLPVGESAHSQLERALEHGYSHDDVAAVARLYSKQED